MILWDTQGNCSPAASSEHTEGFPRILVDYGRTDSRQRTLKLQSSSEHKEGFPRILVYYGRTEDSNAETKEWKISTQIGKPFGAILPCLSPREFVFQEQSYSSLHSGWSLAWDHVRGDIDDPCGVIDDFCGLIPVWKSHTANRHRHFAYVCAFV